MQPNHRQLIAEILAERARHGQNQQIGMPHSMVNPAMAGGIHPLSSQPMGVPHPSLGMQASPSQFHMPPQQSMQMPHQSMGAPQAPMKQINPGTSMVAPKVNFPKLGKKLKQ